MKTSLVLALVIIQLALADSATAGPLSGLAPELRRFTVEMRPGADSNYAVRVMRNNGLVVNNVIKDKDGDIVAVTYDPDRLPNFAALRPLTAMVQSYGPDLRRRFFSPQLTATDTIVPGNEVTPWGIAAVGSQGISYEGGMKVCIIDSGYDLGHPDLPDRNVSGDNGDSEFPWNEDTHGHGSHVAGTIAALGGNKQGVVGVIDSGDPGIFVVRALANGGWTYTSDEIGALMSCVNNGAKVISMSFGSYLSSALEERVVTRLQRRGVLFVAAAGNSMGNILGSGPTQPLSYPASYPSVVSVAAIDSDLNRAVFSQKNSGVDLAAPGVDVMSTAKGGKYELMSGTSMATPHVSGVAALVWSKNKACSVNEIVTALKKGAADLASPGYDYGTGWGLVQVPGALDYLQRHPCTGAM